MLEAAKASSSNTSSAEQVEVAAAIVTWGHDFKKQVERNNKHCFGSELQQALKPASP